MTKKIFLLTFLFFFIKAFANVEIESSNSKEILTSPGEIIELQYLIKNNLKDLKKIKTNINLPSDFEIINEIEKEFILDDQKLISYSIKVPQNIKKNDYQINYEILDDAENKLDSYTSSIYVTKNPYKIQTDMTSKQDPVSISTDITKDLSLIEDKTKQLPITTSFGYNINESSNSQFFLETKGSKLINEKLKNTIEFDLKLPLMHEGTIPKKIDGKPQRFYFGYKTPLYNVLLGDTEYKITPLTISPYSKKSNTPPPLGRGSFITFNRKKLSLGLLYLTKQPFEVPNKRDNILGFLSYKISKNKFTSTIFNTSHKNPLHDQNKNEMTYSLRSTYDSGKSFYDFEYANSSFSLKKDAFYAKIKDKINIFSFDFEGLYAKPKFCGYLSDKYKINSNINFDIIKNLKALSKYKLNHTNLDKNQSLKNADRNFSFLTKLTHTTAFNLTSNFGFKRIYNKDAIDDSKGFKLNKLRLSFTQPIKNFSIKPSFEKGIYKAREERYLSRNWTKAKLQLRYEPFENQSISIYTKHGNFIDSDLYNLGHIYGAKTSIKESDNFEFSLLYEFTHYIRKTTKSLSSSITKIKKSHKLNGSLNYKFASNHVLKLKAKFNPINFSTKTSQITLTYSIPYNVPWPSKNK